MKNVLVVGSLNMDYSIYVDRFPKEGETLIGNSRFIQPGGKGANQAAAIAKSGLVNCHFIGSRGNDSDGEIVLKTLSSINVRTHFKMSKYETGNATIIVDKSSENKIVIVSGANGDLLPEDIDKKLIEDCDFVVLQNEIPLKTNEYVMKIAHELGKVVIYNPAPFRPVDNSIFKYVDYFIPNEIELAQYTGENSIEEGCKKLISLGAKNVIVTLGKEGSVLFSGDKTIKVPAFKVEAIDTVAAGDTFVGYFASGLASGLKESEAMLLASKASSITVTRKGSVVSIPEGSEVKIE